MAPAAKGPAGHLCPGFHFTKRLRSKPCRKIDLCCFVVVVLEGQIGTTPLSSVKAGKAKLLFSLFFLFYFPSVFFSTFCISFSPHFLLKTSKPFFGGASCISNVTDGLPSFTLPGHNSVATLGPFCFRADQGDPLLPSGVLWWQFHTCMSQKPWASQ